MIGAPLQGVMGFIFLAALPVALVLNLCVQSLYRKAIKRAMLRSSALADEGFPIPPERSPSQSRLEIETAVAEQDAGLRWGLAARYFGAGLAFSFTLAIIILSLPSYGFSLRQVVLGTLTIVTAIFPFCVHVAGVRRRYVWVSTLIWIVILVSYEPLLMAFMVNGLGPAAFAAVFLANRAFRTTTLPLYFISIALILPLLFIFELSMKLIVSFSEISIYVAFLILLSVGIILSLSIARLIGWITARSSGLMLQSDTIWLLVTLWQIALAWGDYGVGALWLGLAFVAYRFTLYLLSRFDRQDDPPLLLFLRVFDQRRLQQQFTFGPMTNWRMEGPVILIGAADLATETLDANELSAFLRGAVDRLFIKTADNLAQAMSQHISPSQDGLYPILDYYCHNDTWKPAIKTLMSKADKVVLDLRGFSKTNMGVQFEIEELVKRVDMKSLAVLVDDRTDTALAESLFYEKWGESNPSQTEAITKLTFLTPRKF